MLEPEFRRIVREQLDRVILVCAFCLYNEDSRKANPALTVIEGYAVCEDHLGARDAQAIHRP